MDLLLSTIRSFTHDHYHIDETAVHVWEFVRDLFEENFVEERDLGVSVAIYHQGKLIVGLSGGWFDR